MGARLNLGQWSDWLEPGSHNDSRLLHSDKSDQILVCPSHLGQGYCQQIKLREDLILEISEYTLNQCLIIDTSNQSNRLEFRFSLAGADEEYSFFLPYFGIKDLGVMSSHQKTFEIRICFRLPALLTYFHEFMANLPPYTYSIAEEVIQSIYQHSNRHSTSSTERMLDHILQNEIAIDASTTFEQILTDNSYSQIPTLNYAIRQPISDSMKQIIWKILSCPYQGVNRRVYLKQKALTLVTLYLKAMLKPYSNTVDLSCICQAEKILRNQSVNPPNIEMLARQIGTNRLKLNQGFRQIYGVTPYEHLRRCRLIQARKLLTISELSIEEVAATVGYKSRSRFATAFRQDFGINPKAFQMQAWKCAS
ncbi:MAG: helix-turn-helix transcriptional regulator [Cyanobacteria bacterium P01_G01_bin.67]